MLDFIEDVVRILLVVALGYFAIVWFARRRNPKTTIATHRLLILLLLTTALVLGKISEDAIGGESRAIDRQILLWIHTHTSPGLTRLCYGLTFSGSAEFLFPAGIIVLGALAAFRRKFEALLLALSMLVAWLLTWGLKTAVSRERPALWDTRHYWGSSFPSGHTLNTTCFAIALVVCISRVRPRAAKIAAIVAAIWSGLVGMSRMVLGVHWPTDVMAAACIGLLIPFVIQFSLERVAKGAWNS